MGAATIINHLGDGQYTVKIQYDGIEGAAFDLASKRAILEVDLAANQNTLGQIWRQVEMQRAAVDALMQQWISGDIIPDDEDEEPIDPETEEPVITGNYIRQVVTLTNAARGGGLSNNSQLAEAAQNHAVFMASQNGISHTGSNGSTAGDRIRQAGYMYSICGENVAAGQPTPQAVVDAWMNSPAHRANIMNPAFSNIGVGLTVDPTSVHRYYWCQCFGSF